MQFSAVVAIFAAAAAAHSHKNGTVATATGAASGTGVVKSTSVPTAGAAQVAAPLAGLLVAALAL